MMDAIMYIHLVCALLLVVKSNQQRLSGDAAVQRVLEESNFPNEMPDEVRAIRVKNVINTALEQLRLGRTVFGFDPPEPVVIPDGGFAETNEQVRLDMKLNDLKLYGISSLNIDKIKTTEANRTTILEISIPSVSAEGGYRMNGNVLLLPLSGNGDIFATINDISVYVRVVMGLGVKNGEVVIVADIPDLNFKYGKLDAQLTNLAEGDPTLDEAIHHFINNNPEFIMENVAPTLGAAIANIAKDFLAGLFAGLSPEHIYPADAKKLRDSLKG